MTVMHQMWLWIFSKVAGKNNVICYAFLIILHIYYNR